MIMEKKVTAKKTAVKKALPAGRQAAAAKAKPRAAAKKAAVAEKAPATVLEMPKESAIRTLGRRKEAVAQVRLASGTGKLVVNGRPVAEYFTVPEHLHIATSAQKAVGQDPNVDISVLVKGGGVRGQAEAVRLGIARALTEMSTTFRPTLRKMGYLTRDARVKERKKYGLKSARRAPQFSKR